MSSAPASAKVSKSFQASLLATVARTAPAARPAHAVLQPINPPPPDANVTNVSDCHTFSNAPGEESPPASQPTQRSGQPADSDPQSKIQNPQSKIPDPDLPELDDRQSLALDLLLSGGTDATVATALGLSRRTILRWRNTPGPFRDALESRRRILLDQSGDRFRANLNLAMDVLERQLKTVYENTAFRAARTILTLSRLGQRAADPKSLDPQPPRADARVAARADPSPEPKGG